MDPTTLFSYERHVDSRALRGRRNRRGIGS